MKGARLTVERGHKAWMDRARAYKIMVDGQEAGEVRDGQTETVQVTPGPHEVQMKIDWARSPAIPVEVPEGGEVRVRCWPNANPGTALYYITVGRNKYIGLEPA
jgi:hypothetical protein